MSTPQQFDVTSPSHEIHVNQQAARWVDRLSHEQFIVLAVAAIAVPTITTVGVVRTYKVWRQYRDTNQRVKSAKLFLKSAAAFNPKFYPALYPKIKPGDPLPLTRAGKECLQFPNLSNYRELGHGVNQYNWRNSDILTVQKALNRIDNMTAKDLWTFTTLYTMMSNQSKGYDLVEKYMDWILQGKVQIDDVRAANVPEYAKYDLPKHELEMFEREGWSTAVLPADRAEAYADRYNKAQEQYKKEGGSGAFKLRFGGDDDYTAEAASSAPLTGAKKQQKNVWVVLQQQNMWCPQTTTTLGSRMKHLSRVHGVFPLPGPVQTLP